MLRSGDKAREKIISNRELDMPCDGAKAAEDFHLNFENEEGFLSPPVVGGFGMTDLPYDDEADVAQGKQGRFAA